MRRQRVVILCCVGLFLTYLFISNGRDPVAVKHIYYNHKTSPTRPAGAYFNVTTSPPFTAVIIVTYMRSGSSLTGDILQQGPGAFYVYEPLHGLQKLANTPGSSITFVNGTVRKWPFSYEEEAVDLLRHWLTCDVTKLPSNGLKTSFLGFGIKTKGHRLCFRTESLITKNSTHALATCAARLQAVCETSPLRVLKLIRISIEAIRKLLDEFSGLKILHLIRDPRATLWSQSRFGMCKAEKGGPYGCANTFCTALENDGLEEETIANKYPGRIQTVFYEDIALNPIETSKQLYDFIGTTFTQEAEGYIFNITSAGKANNCAICTTRSNSKLFIDSWKTKISPEFLDIIEKRCNYVLRRYNYTFYSKIK